ncbi:MAG: hypothetical protein ACP5OR_09105 [Candidatus Dormibacteria bacterium]
MEQKETPDQGVSRKNWRRMIAIAVCSYLIIVIGIVAFAFGQARSSGTPVTIGMSGSHGRFTSQQDVFIFQGTTNLGTKPYRTIVAHAGDLVHVSLPVGRYAYFIGASFGSSSPNCTMGYGIIAVTSLHKNVTWYPPFCS